MRALFFLFLLVLSSCAPIQRDFEIRTSLATTLKEIDQVCATYTVESFYEKNGVKFVRVVCR